MRILLATVAGLVVAAGSGMAQTAIGDVSPRGGTEIQGTVSDVFGRKFVLSDASGSILVETGPRWHEPVSVSVGDELRVIGEPGDGTMDAFRIVRDDGSEIEIRPAEGPPPWAGGPRNRARSAQ